MIWFWFWFDLNQGRGLGWLSSSLPFNWLLFLFFFLYGIPLAFAWHSFTSLKYTRIAPFPKGFVSGDPPCSSYAALSRPIRASRLPHACRSGQVQGAGGSGCPKKTHPCKWTLVFPNWSRYLMNSTTWLQLHCDSATGGVWFFRYCPNVFQSRFFCDSYRLSAADVCCCCCCCWSAAVELPAAVLDDDPASVESFLPSVDIINLRSRN